eukprot:754191-Hanusia_phi.AAC.1
MASLTRSLRLRLPPVRLDPLPSFCPCMSSNSNNVDVDRETESCARRLTGMDVKAAAGGVLVDEDIYEVPKRVAFVEKKILSQIVWGGR